MIVFLDFDGVMHPFGRDTFERAGLLEETLRGFPRARVVISSAWREIHPQEHLQRLLGPLGERVEGMTPVFPPAASIYAGGMLRGERQRECEAWLREKAPGAGWVALDDIPDLFLPSCGSLIVCDPAVGFSPREARELRRRLEGGE